MVSQEVVSDPLIKKIVRESVEMWTREDPDNSQSAEIAEDYRKYVYRKWVFIALCIIGTVLVVGYALSVGDYHISFLDTYGIVWDHLIGNEPVTQEEKLEDSIIFTQRMPRIIVGILAGAGLAAAPYPGQLKALHTVYEAAQAQGRLDLMEMPLGQAAQTAPTGSAQAAVKRLIDEFEAMLGERYAD